MNASLPRMALAAAFASVLAVTATAQSTPSVDHVDESLPSTELPQAELGDPWSAVEPEFPKRASRTLERRSTEPASPVLADKGESSQHPWARTLGALAAVVALIVFLAWGGRAMAGGSLPWLGKPRRPGLIEVVTKTPLSARQSLCLVRIGPRLVLIGQSQENLRSLDVIDDADLAARLIGEVACRQAGSSHAEFHQCLEREAHGYQHREDDVDETVLPDAQRIAGVRQSVTDTIRRIRHAVARV